MNDLRVDSKNTFSLLDFVIQIKMTSTIEETPSSSSRKQIPVNAVII